MPKITLAQMVKQWATASHTFEVNVADAAAELGMFATEVFQKSFDIGGFNSKGAPKWRPLKGAPKSTHVALLVETRALKDSITYAQKTMPGSHQISVFTDPKIFSRELRNKNGTCFAAIHNSGGNIMATPGSKASNILQRQFMPTDEGDQAKGDSSYMIEMYQKLHTKIFYGLPK